MAKFIVRRLLGALIVLLVLVAVIFTLQRYSSANPATAALGGHAPAPVVAALDRKLGYDRPLIAQYLTYLNHVLHGNLGTSLRTQNAVSHDLANYVPATAELVGFAMLFALLGALILAITSATNLPGAGAIRFVMVSGASAPVFLLPLLGLFLFTGYLGWLPATGETSIVNAPTGPTHMVLIDGLIHGQMNVVGDAAVHLVMPVASLAVIPAVAIGRVLRSTLMDVLGADYIRTARAKGLSEIAVIFRHALRNCMNAALAMTGLQVGLLFAGVAVVEEIFAWPGVGWYVAQSISLDDFPAIIGVALVGGVVYIVVNAIVDILQALADPRIVRG